MKTRLVKQYICEWCDKRKLSASAMSKHERSCTLNPNRVCRVCQMDHGDFAQGEAKQAPIADLIALLPKHPKEYYMSSISGDGAEYIRDEFGIPIEGELAKEINGALPALRKASGNCPACIMAALRQAGIPLWLATDFNFTSEMKDIWDSINEARLDRSEYAY